MLAGALLLAVAVVLFVANVVNAQLGYVNATIYATLKTLNGSLPHAVKVEQMERPLLYNWLAANIGLIAVAVAGVVVVVTLLRTGER